MPITIPRILGEVHEKDTQFTATMKDNQELVLLGLIALVVLIGVIIYMSIPETRKGTWRYGICRVFLERLSEYPTDLKILTVAEKQNSAQIGYLTTNSYGSEESHLMECFYNTGGRALSISRITINRKKLNLATRDNAKSEQADGVVQYEQVFQLFEDGRREMANKKFTDITLEEFNATIPIILAQEDLDLTMPANLSSNILDLKYD